MEIIRKDVGYHQRFADVKEGECFVLPNGITVYMKLSISYNPNPCVVSLVSGKLWCFEDDKVVVPVKAILTVTDYDC